MVFSEVGYFVFCPRIFSKENFLSYTGNSAIQSLAGLLTELSILPNPRLCGMTVGDFLFHILIMLLLLLMPAAPAYADALSDLFFLVSYPIVFIEYFFY